MSPRETQHAIDHLDQHIRLRCSRVQSPSSDRLGCSSAVVIECLGRLLSGERWRIVAVVDRLLDVAPRGIYDQVHLTSISIRHRTWALIQSSIDLLGAPTAPKRMALCFLSSSSPPSGMYLPVFKYVSELQSKCVNVRSKVPAVLLRVFKTWTPALMTSGPMPSAGMHAIEYVGFSGNADGDMIDYESRFQMVQWEKE